MPINQDISKLNAILSSAMTHMDSNLVILKESFAQKVFNRIVHLLAHPSEITVGYWLVALLSYPYRAVVHLWLLLQNIVGRPLNADNYSLARMYEALVYSRKLLIVVIFYVVGIVFCKLVNTLCHVTLYHHCNLICSVAIVSVVVCWLQTITWKVGMASNVSTSSPARFPQ